MPKKNEHKKHFTVSIDQELIKKLKVYCAMNDKFQNEIVEELLKGFFVEEGV